MAAASKAGFFLWGPSICFVTVALAWALWPFFWCNPVGCFPGPAVFSARQYTAFVDAFKTNVYRFGVDSRGS